MPKGNRSTPAPDNRRSRARVIVIGILLLIACAGIAFQFRHHLPTRSAPASSAAPPAANQAVKSLKDSIMVADFINKTGDPGAANTFVRTPTTPSRRVVEEAVPI